MPIQKAYRNESFVLQYKSIERFLYDDRINRYDKQEN